MNKVRQNNGAAKIDVYKVDRSPETMKKVRAMFKDIEHIKSRYSAVQVLKMIRHEKTLT